MVGLLIAFVPPAYLRMTTDGLAARQIEFSLFSKRAQIELDYLKQHANRLDRTVDSLRDPKPQPPDAKKTLSVPTDPRDVFKDFEQTVELTKQAELKSAEMEAIDKQIRLAEGNVLAFDLWAVLCPLVGLPLSIYGFRNWRVIQLIQDQLLRKQLSDLNKKNAAGG